MSLSAGARLGPYEILSAIGAGGMGEVYKARDSRLDRLVAIKVLPESFAGDADRLRRFEIEAKAAGALNHPNILVVHDIGTGQGAPYLVSELLEGESLRERLKRGKLSPAKAVEMARQIVAGLVAAHAKNIVHRDLKPDNLFVTRDGRVKILDFGLAKVTALSASAADGATRTLETDPGMIVGTMAYMSPEQVRGQAVDPRSDIFSFGCVFYEMLTGQRAFQGPSAADTMSAILNADPVETLSPGEALPPSLLRTVSHCLEKDAGERFQSAKDLLFDLEAAPSTSGPASAAVLAPVKHKRIPVWVPILACAIAVAAGWWLLGRPKASSVSFERLTFRRGIIHEARFAPDGRTVVYSAAWGGQPLQIFSTQAGQPESRPIGDPSTALFAISPAGELATAVGAHFLGAFKMQGTLAEMPLNGGAPHELLENVNSADWSPDGKQMAVVLPIGANNARLEFPPGHVLYHPSGTGWPGDIRFSPKGDQIAFVDHYYYGDDGSVALIDLKGNRKTISTQYTSLQGLAWSPNGEEVWFTASKKGGQRSLYAASLSGRERLVVAVPGMATLRDISKDGRVLLSRDESRIEIEFVAPGDDRPRDLSWLDWSSLTDLSADGSQLAISESGDGTAGKHLMFLRKTDGSPAIRLGEYDAGLLSPDGKWLLARQDSDTKSTGFWLLPLRAGTQLRMDTGMSTPAAFWCPNSRRIAFTGGEGSHRRVYVQEIGSSPHPVTPEGVRLIGVTPDGSQLLTRSGDEWLFYPVSVGSPLPVPALTLDDSFLRFAGDSQTAFVRSASSPERIQKLDMRTGHRELWRELRPSAPSGIRNIGKVSMSQDGKAIAYNVYRTLSELYLADGLK